jgi:hypothetical protein
LKEKMSKKLDVSREGVLQSQGTKGMRETGRQRTYDVNVPMLHRVRNVAGLD